MEIILFVAKIKKFVYISKKYDVLEVLSMSMAVKVKMLLAAREMTQRDLAEKLGKAPQNLGRKLKADNLTERDLTAIAGACGATFEGGFILNDTGKEIR